MYPDEQLMMEVRNGNLRKLSPLFEKYHVPIFNFFRQMTFDRSTSEDLTQNVFERVIKYRDSYKEDYHFRPWLYRIASNVKYDYYRYKKRRPRAVGEEFQKEVQDNSTQDSTVLENEARIQRAMKHLQEEQRKVLWLTKFMSKKIEYLFIQS